MLCSISDAFFSLDRNFILRNIEAIRCFTGEKHIALPDKRLHVMKGIEFYDWSYRDGLSDNPHVISTGCNSGHGALNLCYLKGSKEIHLVGYDMDPKHNSQFQFWSKKFDDTLPQLESRGIKVWNHNVNSHITAFERVL